MSSRAAIRNRSSSATSTAVSPGNPTMTLERIPAAGAAAARRTGAPAAPGAGPAPEAARGGHAVEKGEDLELGFELVRDEVDGDLGVLDGVFNGGDEPDLMAEFGEVFSGVAQLGGHDVFQRDGMAGGGAGSSKGSSGESGSDNGEVEGHEV